MDIFGSRILITQQAELRKIAKERRWKVFINKHNGAAYAILLDDCGAIDKVVMLLSWRDHGAFNNRLGSPGWDDFIIMMHKTLLDQTRDEYAAGHLEPCDCVTCTGRTPKF